MVAEAQRVRERVLKDLARRRKSGRQQLEQLRAARERLLEAHETVRRTLEEATNELLVSLPEARVAAVDAGRRAETEPEATVEELESEIHAAREAGLPLVAASEEPVSAELHDSTADVEDALGPGPAAAEATEPSEPEPEPAEPVAPPVSEMVEVDEAGDRAGATGAGTGAGTRTPSPCRCASGAVEPDAEPADTDVNALFARLRAEQEAAEPEPVPEPEPGREPSVAESATATPRGRGPTRRPGEDGASVLTLLERRDAVTDELERNLARRLKRVLADEQNAVLDAVRRARKLPSPEDVIPDPPEHEGSYAAAAVEDLTAAAAAGVAFQGPEGDPPAPNVEDLAATLASEFTALIRPRLERCFEDLDGDEEELMNRLRASYREWKSPRIIEVTRHHVLAAFSRGQFEAMPEGTAVEWVVDQSGPACSDAEDNSLAGTITKGDAFPTGHRFPPAHAGLPLPDRPRRGARPSLTCGSGPNLGSRPPSVGSPAMRPPSDMPPRPPRRRQSRRGRRLPSGRGRVVLIVVLVGAVRPGHVAAGDRRLLHRLPLVRLAGPGRRLAGRARRQDRAGADLHGSSSCSIWTNLFIADRIAPTFRLATGPGGRPRRALPRAGRAPDRHAAAPASRCSSRSSSGRAWRRTGTSGSSSPTASTSARRTPRSTPTSASTSSSCRSSRRARLAVRRADRRAASPPLVAHYLNGGIRVQVPGQRVTPQVKAHVSVLLGVLALVKAGQYWLERYELMFSTRGTVDGATYTDVNVQLKAIYLLMIISITAFVLFIVNIRRRGWVLPGSPSACGCS